MSRPPLPPSSRPDRKAVGRRVRPSRGHSTLSPPPRQELALPAPGAPSFTGSQWLTLHRASPAVITSTPGHIRSTGETWAKRLATRTRPRCLQQRPGKSDKNKSAHVRSQVHCLRSEGRSTARSPFPSEAAGIRFGETGICDGLRGCGDMPGPRTLPGHLAAPLGMATVC